MSASNCKAVLFNNASLNQKLVLPEDNFHEIAFLFESLNTEFQTEAYANKIDALAAYLKIIMIKMANINALLFGGYDSYEKQIYRKFLELVSQHYRTSHEVANYAVMLNISARKLTDLSKRCCGKGAKEIINSHLTAEAKRSLQFSSRPVKEIAYDLNFSTPDQFSHFFKKNVRLYPQDYRMRFLCLSV